MEIDHFSHEHPLSLIESERKIRGKYSNKIRCTGCDKICTVPLYACTKCSFYLHKSCAELPREFKNPFHPHLLTLLFDGEMSFACRACFKACKGFYFRCEVCDIDLDVGCAFLMPTVGEVYNQLQHFTHLHPLTLVKKADREVNRRARCLVCGEYCLGPCYGCDPCGIFLHQPCAEFQFPQEFQHSTHPCPLTLRTRANSFRCQACDTCMLGICYHCDPCSFYIDVECALISLESEDKNQIKHFSHRHPLLIQNFDDGDHVCCFACGTGCLGPTYVCKNCGFSLHKSCARLPPKIYELLHPYHPLTLLVRPTAEYSTQVGFRCNVCCDDCNGLTYICKLCDFNLHGKCTGLVPTVKYEGHKHLLLLVEKIGLEAKCDACDSPCDSWLLRCPHCNFNLHLRCGPLPYTIKHKCHIDSLTLIESPVEDDSDDEFYCDGCEEERDPRLPIYYCASCPFVAEISCVISEVKLWLKGEYGDVELRTPVGKIAGKVIAKTLEVKEMCQIEDAQAIKICSEPGVDELEVNHDLLTLDYLLTSFNEMGHKGAARAIEIHSEPGEQKVEVKPPTTLHDILNSLTEEESMELNNVLVTKETETSSAGDQNSSAEQDSPDISFFLDEAYIDFVNKLDFGPKDSMNFWDKEEEIVDVRDYSVPPRLVSILESLFAKYGDVSADTTHLSSRVKMYLFVILCGTLDSMCSTRVVDISEDLLINWWKYLKALLSEGFKIQFAFDHLKRVARAYFGLRLREEVATTRLELDTDITECSEEVDKLTKKLKLLHSKRERIISEESGRKSSLIEECLREACKLKWRKAGQDLELNQLG